MSPRPRRRLPVPGAEPSEAVTSRVREVHRRLRREHGPLDAPRRLDPLEELVLTILSQNTSDVNRDRAYAALRERYPSWKALAEAKVDDLARTIRPGGLSNIKAPRILAVLDEIRGREGDLDLSWMRDASDDEVVEYLVSLPGVGPKTAACVLAFSLGRPALPVDTHVHRVASRLGLLPPGMQAGPAHAILLARVPPRLRVPLHIGLIRHGRTICRGGRPLCERCVLADICPTGRKELKERLEPADNG